MAIKPIEFDRLEKGQFDSLQPSDVPSGGWREAYNFLPYRGRMNRRDGSQKFSLDTRAATSELSTVIPVSGLVNAEEEFADWCLVSISREGEVELLNENGSWDDDVIPSGSAATVSEDEMPWRCLVRNSRVYAVRRGGGRMRRIEGGVWRDAGRPAPVSAPTLAVSGSGSDLATATYQVAYGYYDSETGYYGNPGPTDEIAVTAGQQIDVDDLVGKSTAFFATHIVIYCSQPDGQALFEYGMVACPDAPATTTATITADPQGAAAPTRNGQPDANVTWVEEWGERFWWANGSNLLYSPVGEFESYSDIQAFEFEKGSGSDISVVYSWGNRLVIGKRRKMFLLAGFDRSSWEKKPWSTKIGCVAPFSMRNCEGRLIFKSEDGFAMSTDGEEPQVFSTDAVGTALEMLDREREDLTFAEVFPKESLYIAVFPRTDGKWTGVCYNWSQKAWAVLEFPSQPRSLRLGYDSTGDTRLFAVMNSASQVYTLLEGNTDDGDAIVSRLLSGAPPLAEAANLAAIRGVRALTAATRWPVTVSIYGDGDDTSAIASTTVSMDGDDGWKRIAVDNMGDPRTQLQVGFTYSGKDPFWITAWAWDVMTTGKHLDPH